MERLFNSPKTIRGQIALDVDATATYVRPPVKEDDYEPVRISEPVNRGIGGIYEDSELPF